MRSYWWKILPKLYRQMGVELTGGTSLAAQLHS